MSAPDAETLRGRLVEQLVAAGAISADWRAAFQAVPRHAFIPDIWHHGTANGGQGLLPRHRAEDPDAWLMTAYQNDSIIIQVDDGAPSGPGDTGILPTSSASMPTVVAVMLAALDVHDGHRVLEIGTGSGYNAALLAHRLGAPNVTTVEIDPAVAAEPDWLFTVHPDHQTIDLIGCLRQTGRDARRMAGGGRAGGTS